MNNIKLNLIKFRVYNYKSIIDSGDCYISDKITVFAGKNESGKTSLLEALYDFNREVDINKNSKPINRPELPSISVTFQISCEDLILLEPRLDFFNKKDSFNFTINKNFNNQYDLDAGYLFEKIDEFNHKKIKEFITTKNKLEKTFQNLNLNVDLPDINPTSLDMDTNSFLILKEKINLETNSNVIVKEVQLELMNKLIEIEKSFIKPRDFDDLKLNKLQDNIPNFVFFETYKDQKIPNEINFSELDTNEFVKDLIKISDLDINLIRDTTKNREQVKLDRTLNIKLKEEYSQFWVQDASNLHINWQNNKLLFWVVENDEFYSPEIRSKGKQWHLAFYIKVTARAKENKTNILLIDEPGLFLHAKAQKDILKKLEESSENMQIIFSTHSPYLIDPNHLDRIKLVNKTNKDGTRITKIHAKADKETLTPILTAIGDDLSQGIRVNIKNSFIVEGISDYYYIHAFKKLLNNKSEINIIPGCGDNIPAIASILFGWGLDPYFILDGDKDKLKNKLQKKLSMDDKYIINLEFGKSTEDLFSNSDFLKYVLNNEDLDISKGKIYHIKENGGKELVAKLFLEKIKQNKIKKEDFSKETITNITEIFKKISDLIENEK